MTRTMTRLEEKVIKTDEKLCKINELPDDILYKIISLLSTVEAVRSSVVCKRWKPLWKNASHLDFDGKIMKLSLSEFEGTVLDRHCGYELLTSCSFRHFGTRRRSTISLKHCPRMHRHPSSVVGTLVQSVVQKYKRLSSLTLECLSRKPFSLWTYSADIKQFTIGFQPRIFSNLGSLELTKYTLGTSASYAFDGCEKLKILKMKEMDMDCETLNAILKNCPSLEKFSLMGELGSYPWSSKKIKIQSPNLKFLELIGITFQEMDVSVENLEVLVLQVTCPPETLQIYALRLKALRSTCKPTIQSILKIPDIIDYHNLPHPFESSKIGIFRYLDTLVVNLDLSYETEAYTLSLMLRSCLTLKTLEITVPVENNGSNSSGYYCTESWEKLKYDCITYELKFATIRGFTGRRGEVEFVKHLIKNAYNIDIISIICNDSKVAEEVKWLFHIPRASVDLSLMICF